MNTMKTAISVDDKLMQQADRAAKQMRVSRSRLFSIAMERYLREQRQRETTAKLNEVYAQGMDPEEHEVLAGMQRLFAETLEDERW